MTTTTAFSMDEYFDILEKSGIKLEYDAGEIYTMWREPLEYRDGVLVTAESGLPLFPPNNDIMAMSGAKPDHNRIVVSLIGAFLDCLGEQGCEIFNSDQMVWIEACEKQTFPDVTIACSEALFVKSKGELDALVNPEIIIEVLSDSTEYYDRIDKYECYQTLQSLREYVLVSVKKRKVEVFERNGPFTWMQRIYNDENPRVKIGACEIDLATLYRMVRFEEAQ